MDHFGELFVDLSSKSFSLSVLPWTVDARAFLRYG